MGRPGTSSIGHEGVIESLSYLRTSQSNQLANPIGYRDAQRRTPDMWTELIAGAMGMFAVVGLLYVVLGLS
jgi:hypothetical protein